jgi:hypothetical protein
LLVEHLQRVLFSARRPLIVAQTQARQAATALRILDDLLSSIDAARRPKRKAPSQRKRRPGRPFSWTGAHYAQLNELAEKPKLASREEVARYVAKLASRWPEGERWAVFGDTHEAIIARHAADSMRYHKGIVPFWKKHFPEIFSQWRVMRGR